MELYVFDDSHYFLFADGQFYGENIGCVDQFTNVVGGNGEVGYDKGLVVAYFYDFFAFVQFAGVGEVEYFSAIEYGRDKTVFTQSLYSFFAQIGSGSSF